MKPDGWKTLELGELAKFTSGGTPSKSNESYWGGTYPWISGKDLKQHYLNSSIDMLTEEGFSSANRAPMGSTLILVRGMTLLKDFPVGFATKPLAFNQDIKALIPKNNIDGLFFSFLLAGNKKKIRQLVSTAGHGTGRIDTESLKIFPVVIPSLAEQQKIAKILSTWDKAITAVETLLSNSLLQKKALIQNLLGSPESSRHEPKKIKFKTITDVADRIQRKTDGGEYPVLTISSLSGFVRQDEKYSRFMAGKSVENYTLLKKGEFAYNKGNSKTYEFGCIFDLTDYNSGLVPHVYFCFKLKPQLSHRYFKYLFEADYLKAQLGKLVNTGVRNNGLLNIKASDFMNTRVPVPTLSEQERIADILQTATEEIIYLRQKLVCLRQEKKALMQQLLTGKRRVKVEPA
jgi:type I restriction enzyme S subunit